MQPTNDDEAHLYKVVVIGDYAVGKSCVDFAVKAITWEDGTYINLQLWDVAGHERFGTMTRVYYKYAIAAVIVFDVSRPATFQAVLKWREDLNSKVALANGDPIPCILLANKCDLPNTKIDKEALDAFVRKHKFILWRGTSAQDDTGIDEAMEALTREILKVSADNAPVKPTGTTKITLKNGESAAVQKQEATTCC